VDEVKAIREHLTAALEAVYEANATLGKYGEESRWGGDG
jgi:hypothetical protein